LPPASTFSSTVTTGARESWMITTRRPLDSVARFTRFLSLIPEAAWRADANPFARSNPRTNLFELNLISPACSRRSSIRNSKAAKRHGRSTSRRNRYSTTLWRIQILSLLLHFFSRIHADRILNSSRERISSPCLEQTFSIDRRDYRTTLLDKSPRRRGSRCGLSNLIHYQDAPDWLAGCRRL
jgi:hypothetical protein